ncbi:YdeI/OmpD-associated family protein [Ekhidna sp. MALMAid0563]|uniref:YdeI/OmpD-associated family protein n=1 Tax=Ekhidna sp. MALMAid0563 TaxID=3143937 RepID=UPI0032DFE197
MKKFKAPILKFESDLWSYYVAIPKEIGNQFIEGDDRRIICTINHTDPIHSALMPKGEIYSVYVKKEFMKKHHLQEGDQIDVKLEKDHSEYGMPIPESFQVLLDQDTEGSMYFHKLTKGKQRNLIHIVGKVKNVDSQLAKGLAIMHHLKEAGGELDFKRLNVLIKEYNNRK